MISGQLHKEFLKTNNYRQMEIKTFQVASGINCFRKFQFLLAKTFLVMLLFGAGGFNITNAQQKGINLNLKDAKLSDVFQKIRETTNYEFVYSEDDLKNIDHLNLQFTNASIKEVLEKCLANTNMVYLIDNDAIIIRPDDTIGQTQNLQTNKVRITGTVTDSKTGIPLPGVNVYFKDMSAGTSTDVAGHYILYKTPNSTQIVFSFIGYELQEINIMNKQFIDVQLVENINELDEIVATGMQRREKSNNIGSVSKIGIKELENVGITTLDQALAGKVSGVYVRSVSGQPGTTGEIQIRGINTMTGNKEPLYVLDGMPLQGGDISGGVNSLLTNGIGNIPPEDILSITILKDATAAAIYGSRAANGVIVIETKVGQTGKDYINYTGKFGVTFAPTNKFSFMNSAQKLQFEEQLYDEFGIESGGRGVMLNNERDNGVISQQEYDNEIARLSTINTNWTEELFRNAFTQQHNLTMSGGDNKLQYFASANYIGAKGALVGNNFNQGGINMKLSRYFSDNVLVKLNVYTTLKKNVEGNAGKSGRFSIDPFEYAIFANTYEQPYNADGSYAEDKSYLNNRVIISNPITYSKDFKGFNILRELNENTLTNMYANMRSQLSIEAKFLKDFRYIGSVVADYTTVHDMDEVSPGTYRSWYENWLNPYVGNGKINPIYSRGSLGENFGRTFNFTLRNSFEYNKKLKKHLIQLFAANEVSGLTNYRFGNYMPIYEIDYRTAGYPSWTDLTAPTYNQLDLTKLGNSYFREDRAVSFITSAMYSFDDRYVFNGNWRSDGVDIIGTDNQFTPLWSMGLKWNLQNEEFFQDFTDIFSRVALSVGYGFTGSINRSVYPFDTYAVGNKQFDGLGYATEVTWGNPVLKWEKKKDLNIGLELSMYKGRFNLEGQYFESNISDLLDNRSIAPSTGRNFVTVNSGSLKNSGVELGARAEVIKNSSWLVELGGNITFVTNELKDVFGKLPPTLPYYTPQNIQGFPINSWFGYKFSHIDLLNGHAMVKALKEINETVDGKLTTRYEDELIDLTTTSYSDMTTNYRPYQLGHIDPALYGGFNTHVVYKSFDFAAYFVYETGNKIVSFQDRREGPNDPYTSDVSASRVNRTVDNLYRWRQVGDITNIPAYSANVTNFNQFLMDTDIEDGSYLKCSQMTIGWRAKPELLKNTLFKALKANIIGTNLFTFSRYSGIDPETRTPFSYPSSPNVLISLTVGF